MNSEALGTSEVKDQTMKKLKISSLKNIITDAVDELPMDKFIKSINKSGKYNKRIISKLSTVGKEIIKSSNLKDKVEFIDNDEIEFVLKYLNDVTYVVKFNNVKVISRLFFILSLHVAIYKDHSSEFLKIHQELLKDLNKKEVLLSLRIYESYIGKDTSNTLYLYNVVQNVNNGDKVRYLLSSIFKGSWDYYKHRGIVDDMSPIDLYGRSVGRITNSEMLRMFHNSFITINYREESRVLFGEIMKFVSMLYKKDVCMSLDDEFNKLIYSYLNTDNVVCIINSNNLEERNINNDIVDSLGSPRTSCGFVFFHYCNIYKDCYDIIFPFDRNISRGPYLHISSDDMNTTQSFIKDGCVDRFMAWSDIVDSVKFNIYFMLGQVFRETGIDFNNDFLLEDEMVKSIKNRNTLEWLVWCCKSKEIINFHNDLFKYVDGTYGTRIMGYVPYVNTSCAIEELMSKYTDNKLYLTKQLYIEIVMSIFNRLVGMSYFPDIAVNGISKTYNIKESKKSMYSITLPEMKEKEESLHKIKYNIKYINTSIKPDNIISRINSGLKPKCILSGLSGSGKSEFVKVVAKKTNKELKKVSMEDYLKKYVGEDIKAMTNVFKEAYENDMIVLIDEADSAVGSRRSSNSPDYKTDMVNHILNLLDDYPVIVFMTTNHPDTIDTAVKRRFPIKVEFGPLSRENIKKIIKESCKKINVRVSTKDLEKSLNILDGVKITVGVFNTIIEKYLYEDKPTLSNFIKDVLEEALVICGREVSLGFSTP